MKAQIPNIVQLQISKYRQAMMPTKIIARGFPPGVPLPS
jgi:hypothetical protein